MNMAKVRLALLMTFAGLYATGSPALAADPISLKVAGNLLATGIIQQKKEQPFFQNLPKITGLPITVDYKPMDVIGIKDVEGLRILKSGLFDIVTLRVAQVSRDDPFFIGIDIAGLNTDFRKAHSVLEAYRRAFDDRLQKHWNAKLLGVWPFGPQVLFCNTPISGLADIKNKKVRVGDKTLADLVQSLGAIPVTLAFGEAQQALSRGVTDCAITGPSSANSAGWPEVTTHMMPIGFFVAHNAYAINLNTWKKFKPDQQKILLEAFAKFESDVWAFSEQLYDDAIRCNTGKDPCTTVKQYQLKNVPVKEEDLQLVRNALVKVSYPAWAELCDRSIPGCAKAWKSMLGKISGIQ
jgi:TRAP-type C4-dicarboxylate transport system substrate-binding protein